MKIKTKETTKATYQFSLAEKKVREIAAVLSRATLSDPCYELVVQAIVAGVVRIGDDDIFEILADGIGSSAAGEKGHCITKIGELSDD